MATVIRLDANAFGVLWKHLSKEQRLELTKAVISESSRRYIKGLVNDLEIKDFLDELKKKASQELSEEFLDREKGRIYNPPLREDVARKIRSFAAEFVEKHLATLVRDLVEEAVNRIDLEKRIEEKLQHYLNERIAHLVSSVFRKRFDDFQEEIASVLKSAFRLPQ